MIRAVLLVYGLVVIGMAVGYLRTGQRGWLRWAARLLAAGAVAALVFFVVLIVERW